MAPQERKRMKLSEEEDDDLQDTIWPSIKESIQHILEKTGSKFAFDEIYRKVYTMVLMKQGNELYLGVEQLIKDHLKDKVAKDICNNIQDNFMQRLDAIWTDHLISITMIKDSLMYLDRVYVSEQKKIHNIYNLGLIHFRNHILLKRNIRIRLRSNLLSMVTMARNGHEVDRMAIRNACRMMLHLGIDHDEDSRDFYRKEFETHFIKNSTDFYRSEAQILLQQNDALKYIDQVDKRLNQEMKLADHYLDSNTMRRIVGVIEQECIQSHLGTIADIEVSGVIAMMKENNMTGLNSMYKLFKRVEDGLKTIMDRVSSQLRKEGKALIDGHAINKGCPIQLIHSMLEFKIRYDNFLANSFEGNNDFHKMMSKDFGYLINIDRNFSEYLVLFLDNILKKNINEMNDEYIEDLLDKYIVLFRFLEDRDVFEFHYKQSLGKRLLLLQGHGSRSSTSEDVEKKLISRLKMECGCEFTSKMEGMIRDLEVSKTVEEQFKVHVIHGDYDHMTKNIFSMRVLTQGFWPFKAEIVPVILPASVERSLQVFKDHYQTNHKGRKLTLNPQLGSMEIEASFFGKVNENLDRNMTLNPRKKVLTVSTYLMVILFKFNQKDKYTFQELQVEANIPEKDLKRSLQSLIKEDQRILLCEGSDKEMNPSDIFTVNEMFTCKKDRLKIRIVKGDAEPEIKGKRQAIDEDRKYEVEASVMRIMKAQLSLDFGDLVVQVTNQLAPRFIPHPDVIKNRVESLIEREYLRVVGQTYHYAA